MGSDEIAKFMLAFMAGFMMGILLVSFGSRVNFYTDEALDSVCQKLYGEDWVHHDMRFGADEKFSCVLKREDVVYVVGEE